MIKLDFLCGKSNEDVRKICMRQQERESKLPEVPAKHQSGGSEQALRSCQLSSV